MPAPQPPKRKPLGPAIKWSESDLDALSQISPADIAAARTHVKNALPAVLHTEDDRGHPYALRDPAALWDATEEEG
jgi:hypothetical protein